MWPDSYTSFDVNFGNPYDIVQSLEDIKSTVQQTSTNTESISQNIQTLTTGLTPEEHNKLMNIPDQQDIADIIRNTLINVNFGKLVIDKKLNKMFTYDKDEVLISEYNLFDDMGRPSSTKVYKREVVK